MRNINKLIKTPCYLDSIKFSLLKIFIRVAYFIVLKYKPHLAILVIPLLRFSHKYSKLSACNLTGQTKNPEDEHRHLNHVRSGQEFEIDLMGKFKHINLYPIWWGPVTLLLRETLYLYLCDTSITTYHVVTHFRLQRLVPVLVSNLSSSLTQTYKTL